VGPLETAPTFPSTTSNLDQFLALGGSSIYDGLGIFMLRKARIIYGQHIDAVG
jgi:hypothetical protein